MRWMNSWESKGPLQVVTARTHGVGQRFGDGTHLCMDQNKMAIWKKGGDGVRRAAEAGPGERFFKRIWLAAPVLYEVFSFV